MVKFMDIHKQMLGTIFFRRELLPFNVGDSIGTRRTNKVNNDVKWWPVIVVDEWKLTSETIINIVSGQNYISCFSVIVGVGLNNDFYSAIKY